MKKIAHILLLLLTCTGAVIEAKPAEITPADVTEKMQEILKAHAVYKQFTPQLAQRSLANFIDLLDPGKTYFLANEVEPWLHLSEKESEQVAEQFEKSRFTDFQEIYDIFKHAIERHRVLEDRLDKDVLPDEVSPKEFKDLTWAKNENELYERLKKLRALQIEVASKIGKEVKDVALQRLKKRRAKIEDEILSTDKKVSQEVMCTYILKALVSSLDTHTMYFTPQEASQFMISVQQKLLGIGVQLRDDVDGFTIIKIVEGGPADLDRSLKVKDKIIAVNDEPVMGMDSQEVVDLIRGTEGTPVVLRVVRMLGEGKAKHPETFDVKIIRGEVVLKESRVEAYPEAYGDGVIAYLRLFSFYQDEDTSSTEDLKKAFLKIAKNNKVLGCVLDLRYNLGGLLPQAVGVAGLFLDNGVMVSIKDENHEVHHLRSLDSSKMWDGPLIVLTNRASASAAEIVAQTLQDYGRGIICGDDHSFGKGSFQTFTLNPVVGVTIDPKGEYKVTRGEYYTPSGKTPQLVGVQSDIVIPSGLSFLEVGEAYSKYPLENDSIPASFQDSLSDVPLFQRDRIRKLYQTRQQKVMTRYTDFIPLLRKNAEERMQHNKMYQAFLEEVKKSDIEMEESESIDRYPDFQLFEGFNIMRDFIWFFSEKYGKEAA